MRLAARILLRHMSSQSPVVCPRLVFASVTDPSLEATASAAPVQLSLRPSYACIWALQSHVEELARREAEVLAEYRFYALVMALVLDDAFASVRLDVDTV
jgi:hypothetical protein